MKQAFLYCDKRSLNDATNYYVGIILDCLVTRGYEYKIVHNIKDIKNPSIIFTITEKYYFFSKLLFPFTKTIYWAQGADAEETKLVQGYSVRYFFRLLAEFIAIKFSDILFVVSDKMFEFFISKYHVSKSKNKIVMPCYNLHLSNYFDEKQYQKRTFVYAGNCAIWQSVDEMLDVFSLLEKKLSEVSLTILSSSEEQFLKKIRERNILNFNIKYVPVDKLNEELHKYKYGFLLRQDNIVNNVATPTKMNSYLSNYIIPIFSDAVFDFKENIELGEFNLMTHCPLNKNDIVNMIINFETNQQVNYMKYYDEVNRIFEIHYNDNKYKKIISDLFTDCQI